ncbi:ABC transporter substrate-binding protein [Streptosporangium lutulentum]|uniref:NitT/TauT family transport system substrate-binding protein n=1 Tax=Streptosporangium lutulentum TaxID=1461250 RepID=A0ABT9QUE2_9ACTN|nr:ABC transporter substrate-binding protein [Streptosporangium lutulentum]MDP9850382.1 NitT/TauT family transport system substrate-binding protein [Streptosporangium lutulentum]
MGSLCTQHTPTADAVRTNRPEKSAIVVGSMPIPDVAALMIAQDCGFFAREGLTVKTRTIQGASFALPLLENGQMDLSLLNYSTAFMAQAKKVHDVRFVADAYQAGPGAFRLMSLNPKLQTLQDLPGKTISVATKKSIGTLSIEMTFDAAGVTADDDKMVEIPLPDMLKALLAGTVDVAWMTEPFIRVAVNKGAHSVADVMAGPAADFPIAGYGATAQYAAKNPNTVAAFQRAIADGQQIAAGNRGAVTKILPTYIPKITSTEAALIILGVYPISLDLTRLKRVADALQKYGYTEELVDVAPLLLQPTMSPSPATSDEPLLQGGVTS